MTSEAVQPINSFQRDDMSRKARSQRRAREAGNRSRRKAAKGLAGADTRRLVKHGFCDATKQRLDRADIAGSTLVDDQGVRRIADPLETLHKRQLLHRDDSGINSALRDAGLRYRELWYGGQLTGIAAQDLTRDGGRSGAAPCGVPTCDYAMVCRDRIRLARLEVGPRLVPYLDAVVIEERPIAEICALVSDISHQRTAEVIAKERLCEALHRLAGLWRMYTDHKPRAIRAGFDAEHLGIYPSHAKRG